MADTPFLTQGDVVISLFCSGFCEKYIVSLELEGAKQPLYKLAVKHLITQGDNMVLNPSTSYLF